MFNTKKDVCFCVDKKLKLLARNDNYDRNYEDVMIPLYKRKSSVSWL